MGLNNSRSEEVESVKREDIIIEESDSYEEKKIKLILKEFFNKSSKNDVREIHNFQEKEVVASKEDLIKPKDGVVEDEDEVNPSLQIQTPRPKSTSVEEEVVILQEESVKVVKNPLVDNTIYEEEDDDSNEEDDEADKESYRSWDDLCDYRSNGEKSTEYEGSESEGEEEYSGYDEYYESGADGGYWLYGDHYLMTIPGYALFCEDQATTDRGELNCLWKELKKDNHSKYHEYIQKHKEQDPVGFYKFRRHQTNLDRCLYPKKIKVVNVL